MKGGERLRCGTCGAGRRASELTWSGTVKDLVCKDAQKCQHAQEAAVREDREKRRAKRGRAA